MEPSGSSSGYGLSTIVLVSVISFIIYHFIKKSFKPAKVKTPKLSEDEIEELLSKWSPEPLVPETSPDHHVFHAKSIDGKVTKNVDIEGKKYLNLSTSNFLSLVGESRIEEAAKKTIYKYGVGSCGPRGFYGTVDVHLDLENELAKFMGTEEAVLYSYGFATIASAISAYAKAGDIIYVDRNVNFAIQKGLQSSRSRVEWFNHNDMEDLEQLLIKQAEWDSQNPKLATKIRRFLVVEGLYANSGDLCPLPKIIQLKWKYKVRVFIDESWSFGVVGRTGRGVTEHFEVPIEDVDMVMSSLENAIASTGGFCVGRSYIVAHQRLSGQGYCFSASLPPLLAVAASEALNIIKEQPERIAKTQQLSCLAHTLLQKVLDGTGFVLRGVEQSPMKHIGYDGDKQTSESKLDALVEHMFEDHSVLLTRARYLDCEESFPVLPSIRFMIQYALTEEELQKTVDAIGVVIKEKL